jgi:hypothetical protein
LEFGVGGGRIEEEGERGACSLTYSLYLLGFFNIFDKILRR